MLPQSTSPQEPIALPLLDSFVHALRQRELNQLVDFTISVAKKRTIAHHNLHSLYLCQHDLKLQQFYDEVADYTHVDGMSLVVLGRFLGLPLTRSHRTTYVDWIPALMLDAIQNNWKIFYLGSKPGIAERGAQNLKQQFPSLQIETLHGYFDARPYSSESLKVIDKINAYQPQILMVGMGMPRQEHWIFDHHSQLNANVILPCGAAIDYFAGAIPTPPRWAGQLGLEWLFRLVAEPNRLWRRYLIEPLLISKLVLAKLLGL